MILSGPIPWHDVPAGVQVLIDGIPRTVIGIDRRSYPWFILAEGLTAPMLVEPANTVRLVALDTIDAVANLRAAGLTATEIKES